MEENKPGVSLENPLSGGAEGVSFPGWVFLVGKNAPLKV